VHRRLARDACLGLDAAWNRQERRCPSRSAQARRDGLRGIGTKLQSTRLIRANAIGLARRPLHARAQDPCLSARSARRRCCRACTYPLPLLWCSAHTPRVQLSPAASLGGHDGLPMVDTPTCGPPHARCPTLATQPIVEPRRTPRTQYIMTI
jgi:hypothetical protein